MVWFNSTDRATECELHQNIVDDGGSKYNSLAMFESISHNCSQLI